jgi:hypothetical protein
LPVDLGSVYEYDLLVFFSGCDLHQFGKRNDGLEVRIVVMIIVSVIFIARFGMRWLGRLK